MIRVGIVGVGRIADLHVLEYIRNPKAQIVGLCDFNVEHAEKKAFAWGLSNVRIDRDLDAFLGRSEIDLVEILLPHHLHLSAALKAIEADKIVSLQKPMCVSMAEADVLVEAASKHRKPVKIFENFLFYPPIREARRMIDDGAIGTPLSIRIKSNPAKSRGAWDVPATATAWRQERNIAGGGPLVFDDGHHKFALAWSFMGPATDVHAFIGESEGPNGVRLDAPSMVSFRFANNRVGNLEVVYSPGMELDTHYYAQDDRVEITGTEGIIFVNGGHGRLGSSPALILYRDGELKSYDTVATGWEQSFILSTRHFLEAIESGGKPILTPEEGREVLRFALAAEESGHSGRTVSCVG